MKWRKRGLIWAPSGRHWWARSHAMTPTPIRLPNGGLRLLVASVDEHIVSRIGWIDLAPDDPGRVIAEAEVPVLDIGAPGMFDDSGVNPLCVVKADEGLRLYYVGYQLQQKIPYTLFTGAACCPVDSHGFHRIAETPVLDRGPGESFFRTAPFVVRDGASWRMWYVGGEGWVDVEGKMQPVYSLRYAESVDGLVWPSTGRVCLEPEQPGEIGFGRPWLFRDSRGWRMWYSIRGARGYRLGYATSDDGLAWARRDDDVGIAPSPSGWDSEMICYAAVERIGDEVVMFYNGNGYGRTGVGLAVLEND